ncbi:MAG: undecaprenyl-diphosphate phosphatase [Bryobacterales bacterium]|nr:undecaprenyl-diphosphate phosphatase [Bryobacterales bacterium]
MTVLQAAVLAVVQAATEFLPVSSSAHLVLVRWLFGWQDPGLAFDVALHFGTLLALAAYFARTWMRIIANGFGWRAGQAGAAGADRDLDRSPRLLWHLALATLPAAVAGLLVQDIIETHLRSPLVIASMLVAVGVVLLRADRHGARGGDLGSLSLLGCVVVGCAQAVALVPGTSRSGVTIAAGLLLGLRRDAAARLSFLLAMPVVLGASLKTGVETLVGSGPRGVEAAPLMVGIAVSAIVGYFVIAEFLRYLQASSLALFVYYRFGVGALVLALLAANGSPAGGGL